MHQGQDEVSFILLLQSMIELFLNNNKFLVENRTNF